MRVARSCARSKSRCLYDRVITGRFVIKGRLQSSKPRAVSKCELSAASSGARSPRSELLATPIYLPAPAVLRSLREAGGDVVTAGLQDAGSILDSQAKAEYKHRIDELRKDIEEAEKFKDSYRAAVARARWTL